MKRVLLLMLMAFALVAAGCGDDSSDSNNPSNNGSQSGDSAATKTAEDTGAGGSGKEVTIHMKNIAFDPKDVTVKVGTKVKWVNDDDAPHNVTGGDIKSDTFGKGGTFEYTADEAGTIKYVCTVHPGMDATLTVTS